MNSGDLKIDRTWSLFLDRDGVINERIVDDYVRSWDQFIFLPGVLEAMKIFKERFGRIFVVSNQQGVGKGLMAPGDVITIHARMQEEIRKNGGSVDAIYFSPFLEKENSIHRKPNVGMALQARKEFPGVKFKNSIMVGDSLSDMHFGKRLKMKTVILTNEKATIRKGSMLIDYVFPDLLSFARSFIPASASPGLLNSPPPPFLTSSSKDI